MAVGGGGVRHHQPFTVASRSWDLLLRFLGLSRGFSRETGEEGLLGLWVWRCTIRIDLPRLLPRLHAQL